MAHLVANTLNHYEVGTVFYFYFDGRLRLVPSSCKMETYLQQLKIVFKHPKSCAAPLGCHFIYLVL